MTTFFGGEGILRGLKPGLLRVCNHQCSPFINTRSIGVTFDNLNAPALLSVDVPGKGSGSPKWVGTSNCPIPDKPGLTKRRGAQFLRNEVGYKNHATSPSLSTYLPLCLGRHSLNDPTNFYASQPGYVQPESSAAAQLVLAKPSLVSKIFIVPDGLRAGWSLLLFIFVLSVLLKGVAFVGHKAHLLPQTAPVSELPPSLGLFAEGLPFLMTFLAAWIMSKIEKRPNSVYGLSGSRALRNFFAGLAWGVTRLSLLIFTLWKAGLLVEDNRLLYGAEALRYAIIWLLVFLMVGCFEEYLTRGYVLFTLTRGLAGVYSWLFRTPHAKALGFWTAALCLSLLFGLGHKQNPGESPIGLLAAGLVGLVFSLSLWRTGSLWWAIGFHAAWDWAQSFLYGVADSGLMVQHHFLATHAHGSPLMSGGSTGPEGSVFVLPILALVTCILVVTLPRGNYGNRLSPN